MLMPSIFGENLFDDNWMDFPFEREFWGRKNPGFKKDEINVDLENGYLTISAAKGLDKDEKDKEGKYIRRERYAGAMQRSFYVGDTLTHEDIKARFEDGILRLSIPKKDVNAVETKKTIAIEG